MPDTYVLTDAELARMELAAVFGMPVEEVKRLTAALRAARRERDEARAHVARLEALLKPVWGNDDE